MPIRPLNINPGSEADLRLISAASPANLRETLTALRAAKAPIVSPVALRKIFNQNLDEDVSRVLTKQLIALGGLIRQSKMTPSEVIQRLTLTLRTRWKDEKKEDLKNWESIAPVIQEFLADTNVAIAAKAVDLSFDFEHNYDHARILTDIRPIFDEPRSRIIGAIVGHRLRLAYHDAERDLVTMTIAMDLRDVEQLLNACKDAIAKATVAKELVEKKAGLESFVGGEDNDIT